MVALLKSREGVAVLLFVMTTTFRQARAMLTRVGFGGSPREASVDSFIASHLPENRSLFHFSMYEYEYGGNYK